MAERRDKDNGKNTTANRLIRCGIYTRKSTEEGLDQEFNTLDAQREAAESFIGSQRQEGWVALSLKYDDGGYTGANMERPALKRLLADVEAGTVNCVVVYKVDRLSRSLLDFARIMEILDKHGATFVSVTQQFNTTSSMGRLTLNILLSFAQFEREMISERTRDKMGAARRKGKWVGGNPVLGYDVAPRGGSLVVNPTEAPRVREIFKLYLDLGSLIPVVEELHRRGWGMKSWTTRAGRKAGGKPICKNNLYNLLTNMIYIGKIHYRGQVYQGEHDRIVDDDTWNRVQTTLKRNGRRGGRNIGNKHGALLKGLVRCASCDVGMIHTWVAKKDRLYRYYVCVRAHQRGWAQCETRSVSAPALEDAVVGQLRGVGQNPSVQQEVLGRLCESRESGLRKASREREEIRAELKRIGLEMKDTVSGLADGRKSASGPAARLAELQERASCLNGRYAELVQEAGATEPKVIRAGDVEAALKEFDSLWEQLSTWERERFIRTLVEYVRYDGKTGKVTLGFRSRGIKDLCEWAPSLAEQHGHK